MDLLKAASDRLAAAKSMSFTAVASYEYPSQLGPPILYTVRYDVTMQRPDKLRVIIPGDGPASEFYYDGKSMMAYAPAGEFGRGRRRAADDRRRAEGRIRHRRHLLSVHRSARRRSLCRDDGRRDPRVLHRSVGRWSGARRPRWWRGPTATCSCRSGSAPTTSCRAACARSTAPIRCALRHQLDLSNWQIDAADPSGRVHVGEGQERAADEVRPARARVRAARPEAAWDAKPSKAGAAQPAAKSP